MDAAAFVSPKGSRLSVWNDGYFSDMSVQEWVTVALLAPLMLGWLALAVTLVAGMLRSRSRRRQAAAETRRATTSEPDQSQESVPGSKS